METPDLFGLFVRPLDRAGLRYMVSGSLVNPELLDRVMLDRACAELGLSDLWRQVQVGG